MGILSSVFGGIPGEKGKSGIGLRAKSNESGLKSFYYGYHGSRRGSNYTVVSENGKAVLKYDSGKNREFGLMEYECEASLMEALYGLYKDCNICSWNGFSKVNKRVLDGDGFSLKLIFNDGKELSAYGSNAFPKGYGDFIQKLDELMTPVKNACLAKYRSELIAKGINGNLNSVFAYFLQKGTVGKDMYQFHIFDENIRGNNCSFSYKSNSGEYFAEGEKSYSVTVPIKDIGLEKVRKMIDDYDILDWYDFDEAAEDYNNAEWFQVSFGFDDGLHISACGTAHPDHYDEFRAAFLSWLSEEAEPLIREKVL